MQALASITSELNGPPVKPRVLGAWCCRRRGPFLRRAIHALFFAAAMPCSGIAFAQDPTHPAIAGFGAIAPASGAAVQPDSSLRYRVVFDITKVDPDRAKPNPSLDRVARFVNLLGSRNLHARPGDLVAIVHGPATALVLTDAAYRAKFGSANPNLPLITALAKAGVKVHVCSQALNGAHLAPEEVTPLVTADLSAITTLATLQLRGWALIPD